MAKRPVNLYVVSRLLLAGISYKELHALFGWPKSTIRDAAREARYRLPSPEEIRLAADQLVPSMVEAAARQGLSKRETQRLWRVPASMVERWWPRDVAQRELESDAAVLAIAMLEAGEGPERIRAETGLNDLQIHRLRQAQGA